MKNEQTLNKLFGGMCKKNPTKSGPKKIKIMYIL